MGCSHIALLYCSGHSKGFTFTHSHTHSCTDGRGLPFKAPTCPSGGSQEVERLMCLLFKNKHIKDKKAKCTATEEKNAKHFFHLNIFAANAT